MRLRILKMVTQFDFQFVILIDLDKLKKAYKFDIYLRLKLQCIHQNEKNFSQLNRHLASQDQAIGQPWL